MFDTDYNFKGKHANIVTQLTTEIDSDTKFQIFNRNIDVYILAPIVGYLYGRMAERDDSGTVTTDNVKKINYQQISSESKKLFYNYRLIMLLHEKNSISMEERLNRAFRYTKKDPQMVECEKIYERYMLGGVEVIGEKILDGATSIDDFISNMYNFVSEYNERYNNSFDNEEILNLLK